MERRDALVNDLRLALMNCVAALDRPQSPMQMRMTLLQIGEVMELQAEQLRQGLMQKRVG